MSEALSGSVRDNCVYSTWLCTAIGHAFLEEMLHALKIVSRVELCNYDPYIAKKIKDIENSGTIQCTDSYNQ